MIILWSLAAAGSTILVHSVICRLPEPGGTVARFIGVAVLAAAFFAALAIHAFGFTASTISGLLVFAFCCELYLFLITLSLASVSANVLTRLLDGPLTASALDRIYSGASMSASRVERLKRAELVTETGAGLTLSRRGRVLVSLMSAMRRLFGHEPIGEKAHPTATGRAAADAYGALRSAVAERWRALSVMLRLPRLTFAPNEFGDFQMITTVNKSLAAALFALSFAWVGHLIFSDAAWLHPEVLGSSSYVWLYPGDESFLGMLRKMLDWMAFDPNVNRVRPLNDATEVIDAIARPYLTWLVGVQPGFSVSTAVTLIAAPALLLGFLRKRIDFVVALCLCALFISTIGFLSLTVSYWHPAKKLNLVFLCASLYLAERTSQNAAMPRSWYLLAGTIFASFFADELGLANYAIVLILYWPAVFADRRLIALFAALPAAFLVVGGIILPAMYWLLSVHGIWNAVGDTRKFAVFGYLFSIEFYGASASGLARSFLSTVGVRTHTGTTEVAALLAIIGLPIAHILINRLSLARAARDPFMLSTVALIASSVYATLLDWFPFPHEVSYLGSFNYYYHSSIVVLVIVWLACGWAALVAPFTRSWPQTAAIGIAAGMIYLNFAMFAPVNRLMMVIHYYPYSRATLFDHIAGGLFAPKLTPEREQAAFGLDLDTVFEGRQNGFMPILQMVERTPIMTDGHVKNLPHIFFPMRRASH